MLAFQDIENLFKNSLCNETLFNSYLPMNNNPSFLDFNNVIGVMIIKDDENGKKIPLAFGVTQKITNNQYYTMVNVTNGDYQNKHVSINKNQLFFKSFNHKNLSILSINNICEVFNNHNGIKSPISTYLLPYNTVFVDRDVKPLMEILFDETIKKLNINNNFYVNKNMTIDFMYEGNLIDKKEEQIIMNSIGFNIVDRMYLQKCTHTLESLRNAVNEVYNGNDNCLEIENHNLELIFEYDNLFIGINRKDYLENLFKLGNVRGLMQIDDSNNVIGYILTMNNHILGCYGDDQQIQMNLIKNIIPKLDYTTDITFFLNCNDNLLTRNILENAIEIREIRRHHTLSINTKIKWNKIGIIGIGCHIV